MLQTYGITISMTEDYKPTDNAVAESVNGKIKVESVYRQKRFNSLEHARNVIERYIHFYNYRRPHMSIGYKVPAVAHLEKGEQKQMWKNKIYPKKDRADENNVVSVPSRTSKPWLCVSSFCRSMQTENRISMAFSLVSIKSVRLLNICLLISFIKRKVSSRIRKSHNRFFVSLGKLV